MLLDVLARRVVGYAVGRSIDALSSFTPLECRNFFTTAG